MSNATLSVTVPQDVAAFVDDAHWDLKMTKGQLLATIVTEWAVAHGYTGSTEISKGKPGRKPKGDAPAQ